MDVQTIRRAVYDLFRFNPKDFIVQGSLTGYQVSAAKRSSGAVAAEEFCELGAHQMDPGIGEDFIVGFYWGRINGRQPLDFSTEGLLSPFVVTVTSYFYAAATADLGTLTWISGEIIMSSDPDLANTTDTAYRLLATVTVVGVTKSLSPMVCGAVDFDICELAPFG